MPSINSKKNNSAKLKTNNFYEKCKELMIDGKSISAISKLTGYSYNHTKNIFNQIKNED